MRSRELGTCVHIMADTGVTRGGDRVGAPAFDLEQLVELGRLEGLRRRDLAFRHGERDHQRARNVREIEQRRPGKVAVRRDRASSLDEHGNQLRRVSQFERADGSRGLAVDAVLRYRP